MVLGKEWMTFGNVMSLWRAEVSKLCHLLAGEVILFTTSTSLYIES